MRFALDYPSYELPLGSPPGGLAPEAAPRRLARVRVPGGRTALIHSAYLAPDVRGRANNFLSHVLVLPACGARESLAAWGSPDWAAGCDPEAPRDLPPPAGLPRPGPVNDAAVTAFLQTVVRPGGHDLDAFPCPRRLANAPRRRRELLALLLRGCLLVLRAGPAAPRGRLYLLAEPGLTALLLYAATRLLPDALVADLTFSTYENAHRDLRAYRHAQVVGTWTTDPARGLDAEFFTTRGYALDTFNHRFSPELQAGEPALDEWVQLAGRGDWRTVDRVHQGRDRADTSVAPVAQTLQVAKFSRRLEAGRARAEDLLTLRRLPWGPPLLERHREQVWAVVRDGSLADERLRRGFADLLREHLPELEERLARALRADPAANWQPHWRLLVAVLRDDPARLRETLQRAMPEPPYPPALRWELLQEFGALPGCPADPGPAVRALLRNATAEDLDRLAGSGLPREWFVWALCYALLRPETSAAAARHLHDGDDGLLRAFWEQFRLLKDEGQRRAILTPLFPRADPRGGAFLSRLLKARGGLRPETLEWLLARLGAWDRTWADFWGHDGHRGLLFDLLQESGAEAGPLWDRFCAQIDRDLLLLADPYQTALLADLAAAKDRPGTALPPAAAEAVADWVVLRQHFEKACAAPEEDGRAVIDACNRRGLDALHALARYFERFVLPREMNREVLDDFVGFVHSFYPAGAEYHDYSSRLTGWLAVVEACPEEAQRAAYQHYYLEGHVPPTFRGRLAEEFGRTGKLLPGAAPGVTRSSPAPLTAPPATSADPPAAAESGADVFRLTGVPPAGSGPLWSLGQRFVWLLCGLGGGAVAALVCGLYQQQLRRTAALVLFVPLVLALTDSAALQAAALAGRGRRGALLGLLAGLLFGGVCGLLAGGAALAWAVPMRLTWSLGGAVAGGMAAATLVGAALPAVVRMLRCDSFVAAGPVARALAGALALFAYFGLARWLLGS
jgi:hypothetical protein